MKVALSLIVPLLLCSSCKLDPIVEPLTDGCRTGYAQLLVGEGYLELFCGCNEGSNIIVWQGSSATCTVNLGTTVVFSFGSARTRHQIVGDGTPDFGTSAVVDPNDTAHHPVVSFVPILPATSTYVFHDVFNPSVRGQLVVQ